MNQKVNPIVAVVIAVVVLVGVGYLSLKFFGGGAGETAPTIAVIPDKNDKKFQADPNLGGGGR